MKWFNDLPVARKLMWSFASIAFLAGTVGAVAIWNLQESARNSAHMFSNDVNSIVWLGTVRMNNYLNQLRLRDEVATSDRGKDGELRAAMAATAAANNELLDKYARSDMEEDERGDFQQYKKMLLKFRETRSEVLAARDRGDHAAVDRLLALADQQQFEMTDQLTKLIQLNTRSAAEVNDRNLAELQRARAEIGILLLIAVGAAIGMGRVIGRKIGRPLVNVASAAEQLALGDVEVMVTQTGEDECGRLAKAFSRLVATIRERAAQAEQIAAGNIELQVTALSQRDPLAKSYQEMLTSLRFLVQQAQTVAKAGANGDLQTRGEVGELRGAYKAVVEDLNQGLDAMALPITRSLEHLTKLSRGENGTQLHRPDYRGAHLQLANAFNGVFAAIDRMAVDVRRLVDAGVDGKFDVRVDAAAHQGVYGEIIGGMNQTLDAMIKPVQEGNRILRQIRGGNLRERVSIECRGDHQRMKEAINGVHSWLTELIAYVQKIASGDMSAEMRKASGEDQIHEWLVQLKQNIVTLQTEMNGLIHAAEDGDLVYRADESALRGAYAELLAGMNNVLEVVRTAMSKITHISAPLRQASKELEHISREMEKSSERTSAQASMASAGSEEVSRNVQTVATGADEMGASIREISKSTADASRVATSAVQTAERTNAMVSKLGQSSAEIGEVIKVITSIAQQTNLLALNATIEAARAGDAGKGFAVVANEVKELAKETARATEDISKKIEAIQADTGGAVGAIGEIGGVISQISDIQQTIASAVEEQSATSSEISRNLAEAATGTVEITHNISAVADAARETTEGAVRTGSAAQKLENMAADLDAMISRFRLSSQESGTGQMENGRSHLANIGAA